MELFKLFGTIAVKNSEANSAIDETTDKAKSFSENLSDKFTDIGEKTTKLGAKMSFGLTTPITLIGTKAIQATADFESAMSEVGAISGATGDDLIALENKAKEMGETTKFSASESAEALKYMAMAGWKTGDMLDGLDGVLNLAAASGADLGTTSDIVTDALTAMGYSAGDAGRLADVMAAASSNANTNVELMGETFKYAGAMAGTMGYSMEDTAIAIGLMANSGIKGSMAGTSLNAIISRLATNTSGATECINELGVEFYNADGTARDFGDVMAELREATKGLTTEQKAEIASTVAGEEAKKGLLAILNATSADYDKLSLAINNSSGSAKEMADMMNDNLSGQLTLLKSQLEGLAIQFVTLIMPYLKQGVEWLSKLCDWISGLDDGTKKMIITVAAVLAAAGPVLVFVGKIATGVGSVISIGSKLIGGIGSVIGIVGKLMGGIGSVISIGSKLIGGITTLIPVISSISAPVALVIAGIAALVAIGVTLYKNWDTIKEKAGKAWDAIKETIGNKVEGIKNFFSGLGDFFKNNWQGILSFIVNPIAGGLKLAHDNCEGFREKADGILEKVKGSFDNFGIKVSDGFHVIYGKLADFFGNTFTDADGYMTNFGDHAWAFSEDMVALVQNKIETVTTVLKTFFSAAVALLTGNFSEAGNIVKNGLVKLQDLHSEKLLLIENSIHNFKGACEEIWGNLTGSISEKVQKLKESAVFKFQELKDEAEEKINRLKESTVSKIEEMKNNASEKVDEMKERITDGFQKLKEDGEEKFRDLKEKWSVKFTSAREKIVDEATRLKEKAGEKIGEFKNAAVEKIESFREGAVSKFQEFGSAAKDVLGSVSKSGIFGFQEIREKGLEAVRKLKTDAIAGFQEMGSVIAERFGSVADKIGSVFGSARDAVSKIVSDIKSFFDFEWKLPDIKLPHFNIKWDSSGMLGSLAEKIGLPGLPKFDVDWYQKAMDNPLIMDRPTAFGINRAGQVMAGGEAGSEVVSGTQTLMNMISAAVAENNSRMYELLNQLYDLLAAYLPELAKRQIVLETGALVGELAEPMSEKLAWENHLRGRRN